MGLKQKFVTGSTVVHRFFTPVQPDVINSGTFEIYLDDLFYLGVLSSDIHTQWAKEIGGRHRGGFKYRTECFTQFPFPICNEATKNEIRGIMASILEHRKRLSDSSITMISAFSIIGKLSTGMELTTQEQRICEDNALVKLHEMQALLNRKVCSAYGWDSEQKEQDWVRKLSYLNQERAIKERAGKVHWLRGDVHRWNEQVPGNN